MTNYEEGLQMLKADIEAAKARGDQDAVDALTSIYAGALDSSDIKEQERIIREQMQREGV